MKLNESQIKNLYKFTRKHYVYHYDVQTELVDHLANDIEEISKENPKISFEEARDKSFKKFGIFGFMDVIEAKQKQVGKKYRKIIWSFMKDWFTMPKIILTLLIFLLFYMFMSLNINKDYLAASMLALGLFDAYWAYKLVKKSKKRFKDNKVKYLLEDMIFNAGAFSSVLVFSNLFHLSSLIEYSDSVYYKLIVALLVTLAIIYSYVSLKVIPNKAKELLEETYPEYKILKNL